MKILILLFISSICFAQNLDFLKHKSKYIMVNETLIIQQNDLEEVYTKQPIFECQDTTSLKVEIEKVNDLKKREKLLKKMRKGKAILLNLDNTYGSNNRRSEDKGR